MKPWIGIDLDGTLAKYDEWEGLEHIGEPIWRIIFLVKRIHEHGIYDIKIFTARASVSDEVTRLKTIEAIQAWVLEHIGIPDIEVTCSKDFAMAYLFDDRAITVDHNIGTIPHASLPLALMRYLAYIK